MTHLRTALAIAILSVAGNVVAGDEKIPSCTFWLRAENGDFRIPKNWDPIASTGFKTAPKIEQTDPGLSGCLNEAAKKHGSKLETKAEVAAIEFVYKDSDTQYGGWILPPLEDLRKLAPAECLDKDVWDCLGSTMQGNIDQLGYTTGCNNLYFSYVPRLNEKSYLVIATAKKG